MKLDHSIFRTLLLLCIPLMMACATPMTTPAYDDRGNEAPASSHNKLRADILELINEHRAEKGLPVLRAVNFIETVADGHSSDMASKRVAFGHDGFEARYKDLQKGIKGMRSMAENVAYGKLSAQKVVDLWLNSAGHRKNIEGNYTHTGIGISISKDGQLYFTQLFVLQ